MKRRLTKEEFFEVITLKKKAELKLAAIVAEYNEYLIWEGEDRPLEMNEAKQRGIRSALDEMTEELKMNRDLNSPETLRAWREEYYKTDKYRINDL